MGKPKINSKIMALMATYGVFSPMAGPPPKKQKRVKSAGYKKMLCGGCGKKFHIKVTEESNGSCKECIKKMQRLKFSSISAV